MSQKQDTVHLEVWADEVSTEAKASNEAALWDQAVAFFGHDSLTHNGFRHDAEAGARFPRNLPQEWKPGELRTYTIFADATPYQSDGVDASQINGKLSKA